MEPNIKRTEKVVKRFRDDWFDEKGFLHTKIVKETIQGPYNNVEASQKIQTPLLQKVINLPIFRIQGKPIPQVNVGGSMFRPKQPQVQQQPPIDFGALMKIGKKLMDDMGIDPKELINDIFSGEKPDDSEDGENNLTDEKEVDLKWKKQKTLKQLKKKKQLKTQKKKAQKTQNKKESK